MSKTRFEKLINNKKIVFDKITIFCDDSKILFNYLDLCIHTFHTKKIFFAKNANQLNVNTINLVDVNKLIELRKAKINLSKFFIYIPLRNCFLDYIRFKERLKKIRNLNYKLMFSSNIYNNCEHYTNNLKPNFNNKIYFKDIEGLSLRNKIKYFYPSIFTVISVLKKFNLVKNLIFSKKVIFCGKIYHDKKYNKDFIKHYKFTKFTIEKLDFLQKKNQLKIEDEGLKEFKKIVKLNRFWNLPNYEKFYLIQSFYRAILFTHLKKFSFFNLFSNPKVHLLRMPLLKNTFQIYVDPFPSNSMNNSRYVQIKKFFPNRMIDYSLYSKNYKHTNKEFLKRLNKGISILNEIKKISNKKISMSSFLKKNKKIII